MIDEIFFWIALGVGMFSFVVMIWAMISDYRNDDPYKWHY